MWVLRIDKANLVAFQEIGVEAFAVLRRMPGAVRSITLENPSPPGVTNFTDPIGDLAGLSSTVSTSCA